MIGDKLKKKLEVGVVNLNLKSNFLKKKNQDMPVWQENLIKY